MAGPLPFSSLIPLMGTRPRRRTVQRDLVKPLLDAAVEHLTLDETCQFKKVFFLNYTDREFEICRSLLQANERLGPPRETTYSSKEDPEQSSSP